MFRGNHTIFVIQKLFFKALQKSTFIFLSIVHVKYSRKTFFPYIPYFYNSSNYFLFRQKANLIEHDFITLYTLIKYTSIIHRTHCRKSWKIYNVYNGIKIIQLFKIAQIIRGKSSIFPLEPLNNFSVLFQLFVPFTYGQGVQPIPLATIEPPGGTPSVVSGWGITTDGSLPNQLQAVEVYIVERTVCESSYRPPLEGITVNMICAAAPGEEKDACDGDSGDPLVVGGQLVGIVSGGIGCAMDGFPRVYSNVATLKPWFTEQTGVA